MRINNVPVYARTGMTDRLSHPKPGKPMGKPMGSCLTFGHLLFYHLNSGNEQNKKSPAP